MKQKPVLIDTSVWIGYFRSNDDEAILIDLFDSNRVVINDVVLAELLPAMNAYGKKDPIEKMRAIERLPVFVNWEGLIALQTICIKNGINGISLSDLMIAQTAIEYKISVFSKDKHFKLINDLLKFEIYNHPD